MKTMFIKTAMLIASIPTDFIALTAFVISGM